MDKLFHIFRHGKEEAGFTINWKIYRELINLWPSYFAFILVYK